MTDAEIDGKTTNELLFDILSGLRTWTLPDGDCWCALAKGRWVGHPHTDPCLKAKSMYARLKTKLAAAATAKTE